MKLTTDKYGRVWLVNYRTYTLLNINHIGVMPKPLKPKQNEQTGIY